jgi:hypothetical protein
MSPCLFYCDRIDTERFFYDGEFGMPWNNEPVFGGPPPLRLPAEWHNRDFLDRQESDDPEVWIDEWDGCEILPLNTMPNVNGLGKVTQVESIREPTKEVQELQCKFNPGTRAFHSALYFEERMYIFGGRIDAMHSRADSWYRDDRMPTVSITLKPASKTPEYRFRFSSDEGGCVFEYRLWDHYRYKEIRQWTSVMWYTHVDWLDWRMGGPGNGDYVLYVRGIDPAGNRDERYELGRNMHYWRYISPTPWDIIFGCISAFLFMVFMAYAEYRRRVKKAAMERYAMKRMRRKFKAMQRDTDGRAVDWRTLYSEHKELKEDDADGKKRARDMKKKREKAKGQRDKDKQKRDKEKDKIRKKLKDKEKKKHNDNTGVAVAIANGGDEKKSIASGSTLGAVMVKGTDKKSSEKREMMDFAGDGGGSSSQLSRGKSSRFKDYEIDDGSKKDKLGKMPALTEGSSKGGDGALKRGKSNKFKEYEIDDKESDKAAKAKAKGDTFKSYEMEGGDPKKNV